MPDTTPTADDAARIREVAAQRFDAIARIVRAGNDDPLALDLIDEGKSRLLDAITPGLGKGSDR